MSGERSGDLTRYRLFIGGEWLEAEGGRTFDSVNPYTSEPWAAVPLASATDVDRAVSAARAACPAWRAMFAPWGGFKRSGYGRESSAEAIREYTQTKSVWIDLSGKMADPFVVR